MIALIGRAFMRFTGEHMQPSTKRGVLLFALVLIVNAMIWTSIGIVGSSSPLYLGLAALAAGLGLRHAMDADHIAAIDNAMRRLLYRNRPSVGVGTYFSLGHSTVVLLLTLLIIGAAGTEGWNEWFAFGKSIGSAVAALFLVGIGIANIFVVVKLVGSLVKVSRGETDTYHGHLHIGGPIERLFNPLLRLVDKSYKMYLIGFLFGLGFDTATEVGVLAASALAEGVPRIAILFLPLAFAGGMALLDTLNSLFMFGIYSGSGIPEKTRLAYNVNVTALSALSALVIGLTLALSFIADNWGLSGGIFAFALRIPVDMFGYFLVAVFGLSWVFFFLSWLRTPKKEQAGVG